MVEVLALVLQHDEHKVEKAITTALTSGSPSKQHVINCLNRVLDEPRPALLKPRPELTLVKEPKANTGRYDHLVPCCSIFSASCMSVPASLSPPI